MHATAVREPDPVVTGARPSPFACLPAEADGTVRIAVTGELDIATVPQLDRALRRAEAAAAKVVVLDLRRLEFMDVSGLHLLLAVQRRMHASGRRLVVERGPFEVDWLFALVGIDRELEFAARPPGAAAAPAFGAPA